MERFLAVVLLLLPVSVWVDPQSKQQMINELIDVMQMESSTDATYEQMDGMMKGLSAQMGIKPEEQPIYDRFYEKMTELFKEEVSWQKLSPVMVESYQKHFTEREIREMLAFYKTETGQSIIAKQPLVMQEAAMASQQIIRVLMPKIQALSEEVAEELQQHRKQH
ncbi:DUF2059 domain-containing protein [Ferrimonas sediminicola]|uniref:DUF2059 domain-containing protein n=1 Tax=Ferrimonas sediminicola TaxID=2569538 RepID=A0A4U1B6J4_9GAMM|nr:DUF2059 domain-containing protein [Ferrimonas sediminicola]TKB46005.1 DUF2059 domain-containing protein [Ferrimonas sediminicola]